MRERMLTAHSESPERAVDTPQHTRKAHVRRTYACPDGVKRTIQEMADMASVSKAAMRMRLKNGWSVERALTEPPVTRAPKDGTSSLKRRLHRVWAEADSRPVIIT